MATLELRDVSYTYPDACLPALERVTCRLETGQLAALLGPNGCGKSTLARVAAGLLSPQNGEVRISGMDTSSAWNGVGLLLQNPDEQLLSADVESELAWGLENIALPPGEMSERVRWELDIFELSDMAHLPPEALSDGQKQLVALAGLAVMKPVFLLLDEATAFLDPAWTNRVLNFTRKLSEITGVLWITTRAAEATAAHRVWLMQEGRIAAMGTPAEMLQAERLEQLGIEPLPET